MLPKSADKAGPEVVGVKGGEVVEGVEEVVGVKVVGGGAKEG
jgi:hypothetical protein